MVFIIIKLLANLCLTAIQVIVAFIKINNFELVVIFCLDILITAVYFEKDSIGHYLDQSIGTAFKMEPAILIIS
jgi:hypothetical protein